MSGTTSFAHWFVGTVPIGSWGQSLVASGDG